MIVTSAETAASVAREFGVEAARLEVVEPGTDRAPAHAAQPDAPPPGGAPPPGDAPERRDAGRSGGDTALRLLCVASVVPRKGHDILLQALARLAPDHAFRLDCRGSTTRDPAHAARIAALAARLGLEPRVRFHGECAPAALENAYASADLFVLPAWYEGYGMAVAEAVARGLPVVATAVGAAPRVVGDEAGLLVPAGDATALAAALRRVFAEPTLRARLAAGARRRAAQLPDWDSQAARLARRLEALPA